MAKAGALLVLAVLALPGGTSLAAGGTGQVAGTVTNTASQPLAGICVAATSFSGSGGSTTTDASGRYTLANLAATTSPGTEWRIQFSDCSGRGYATVWFDGKASESDAAAVHVDDGQTTPGIDAQLPIAGSLAGTVTNDSGAPLAGICVTALPTATSSPAGSLAATTDANGQYTIGRLPPAPYLVRFFDCSASGYVDQWYPGQDHAATATPVDVASGTTTTGIDATLVRGATISGTVTNTAAAPLANICVFVGSWPFDPGDNVGIRTTTDSSGRYTAIGIPTGSYQIEFSDCSGAGYVAQWYDGRPDQSHADLVHVTAGDKRTGIDAVLTLGGRISGQVTNESGSPLSGICVFVGGDSASTDAGGRYTTPSLGPGSYTVEFRDCRDHHYARQWFNRHPTPAAADPVEVVAGQTTGSVDAVLGVDTTPPVITVPADFTVTTSGSSAVVGYSATFSDPDDDVSSASCNPPSGALFPLGTTTVTCTATDLNGNTGNASFNVTVSPPAPPPPAGGGGGGGSSGIPPDLHVDVTASATAAPPVGSELDYVITVSTKNSGGASETTLKLTLPAGYTVTGINADRGPGCTGNAPSLTCNTAFINPTATTHLRLSGTVGQAGEQDLTATVSSYPEPELSAADNTVTVKLLPAPALVPPAGGGETTTPPGVFKPPTVRGTAKVGRLLRLTPTRWSTAPTRVHYQWQLCTTRSCKPIPHATRLTLKLLPRYAGKRVRLAATALIDGHTVHSYSHELAVRR